VNLAVLSELGAEVRQSGGRLVVLDASAFFQDDATTTAALAALCEQRGFGYVPVSVALTEAVNKGIAVQWKTDGHFNVAGNQILADSLLRWIAAPMVEP